MSLSVELIDFSNKFHFRVFFYSIIFSGLYEGKWSVTVQVCEELWYKCFFTQDKSISGLWGSPEESNKMCEPRRIRSLLACWSVISIFAFIGLSITVVRPYYRADQMIPTECSTVTATRGMSAVTCDCGKNCGRTCKVTCMFVQVSYNSPINGSRQIGKLSYGEHDLDREVNLIDFVIWANESVTNHVVLLVPRDQFKYSNIKLIYHMKIYI